jgi:hypothetical protein
MKVLTFEEHSSVLAAWWDLPRRRRTLVYFDAHLDLQQISPARLRRIVECTTAQQVAALRKPHHIYPDEGFSFSIEDFLYPAHRLGMIERIIWVAPPHVLNADPAATFERLQQMDGVEFDELLSFERRPDGTAQGRLLGVDLIICDFRELARMSLPVESLIDIDIDFFIALPDEAPWVSPRDVFGAIEALRLSPELVTISRSVGSGFTPLCYRFFADYLAALFEGDVAECGHFDRLGDIATRLCAGTRDSAASACRSELERHPSCPATWHLLSLASGNPREARVCQDHAADLCFAYEGSVLREACEFPARGLKLNLETVRLLENRFVTGQQSPAEDALTWAALGLLQCHLGRVEAARRCYRQTTQHFPNHPELAGVLGNALIRAQQPREAIPFLEAATTNDKTAAGAHMLLGSVHGGAGDLATAEVHLQAASALAPSWTHLLELRDRLFAAAGQKRQAEGLRRQYSELRLQAIRAAERLGAN